MNTWTGGNTPGHRCDTIAPWRAEWGHTLPLLVRISSLRAQLMVWPSPLPAPHHPQAKERSNNGSWTSRFASISTLYVRKIISWLSLSREYSECSRVSPPHHVDDLTLRRFVNIHLLSLTDGSPHGIPLKEVIPLELGRYRNPRVIDIQISGSRIALAVEASSHRMARYRKELIAWDWKTGEVVSVVPSGKTGLNPTSTQVLRHSSDDPDIGSAIANITTMHFLEESWLLALSHGSYAPRLLALNTLLPQEDPRSWGILYLPPLSKPNVYHCILTQHEKSPMECPEFLVDPNQRIFVLLCHQERAFVVPVEVLIRHARHGHTNPWILWEEWGGDVVTVHLCPDIRSIQLYDTKVLTLCSLSSGDSNDWGVLTYDLSKSGRKDIQIQQVGEEADVGCRRILSTSKQLARCGIREEIPHDTQLVGNQVFCFAVSPVLFKRAFAIFEAIPQSLPPNSSNRCRLRIWKIGRT